MARRKKSVASKLIDTYQLRMKQQAAERKRAEDAARKLADQERRAQAAAEKKAAQQEAARKRKEEADRARAVARPSKAWIGERHSALRKPCANSASRRERPPRRSETRSRPP